MESLRELTNIELDEVNGGAAASAATTSGGTAFTIASAGPAQAVALITATFAVTSISVGPFAAGFAF
jgi:hypothetical protein